MVDGSDERGDILLYFLGIIVLISIFLGGLFFLSRVMFMQLERVDEFKQNREVQEYALQEGAREIQNKIEEYLASDTLVDLGDDSTVLGKEIDLIFSSFLLEKEMIGSENQFSYSVSIATITKQELTPYVLVSTGSELGWQKDTAALNNEKTNVEFTFELVVEVVEKSKSNEETKSTASSDFVYEIQWDNVDVSKDITELDVWRNVVYSYYLPNSANYLSAGEWMRKISEIYQFSTSKPVFNYDGFKNDQPFQTGYAKGVVTDITDANFLDFSKKGKVIQDKLDFVGSFFLEHGVAISGEGDLAELSVGNLLGLKNNDSSGVHFINDINVSVNNGIYVDFSDSNGYLVINENDHQFQTGNLLVNNVQGSQVDSKSGIMLGSGQLQIGSADIENDFSFSNYASNAKNKSPQDGLWYEFLKGSMVIASSRMYMGPIDEATDLQSSKEDNRNVNINGNFMITNASLRSKETQNEFSYFQENSSESTPNLPSELVLVGNNTKISVQGLTFIDAPKTNRRLSITEEKNEDFRFYGDETDWNTITLKEGAEIELNYAGIEPFNLNIDEDSVFSLRLLPELQLLDLSFLQGAKQNGSLNGKVILKAFSESDAKTLENELRLRQIPVSIETNIGSARNGYVTILQENSSSDKNKSQIISRTFYYVKNVKY